MRVIRRQLVALVFAVLASQAAGMAVTPVALFTSGGASAAGNEIIACTCPDGGMGKECPMHKHQTSVPSRDTPRCVSCHDNTDAALTTLVGATGLLVERQHAEVPDGISDRLIPLSTRPLDVVRPLLSPPPRS